MCKTETFSTKAVKAL